MFLIMKLIIMEENIIFWLSLQNAEYWLFARLHRLVA
jgi:hypothetical protein